MKSIQISKNGMVKKEIALASGLPLFDFSTGEETGIKFDYCTRAEFAILKIELDEYERENLIVGFFRNKNYRGYLPLYSLQEMIARKF